MTAVSMQQADFLTVLKADARSSEIPESSDLYGCLLGSWHLEAFEYAPDGSIRQSDGEVHFDRVLEGRAVQDVWIAPSNSTCRPGASGRFMCGTTLRVWDPARQAWRVTWINPVTGKRNELVGRKVGNDIVQTGTESDGTPIRWAFTEITQDSFRWVGEVLQPDGKDWRMDSEFRAKRM